MERPLSKEEILCRSQQENRDGDETEKAVGIQGESFGLIFVFVTGIVPPARTRLHSLPEEDVLTMFRTACAASRIYRLPRRKHASDMVALLISLAFLGGNLVKFFQVTG